jgi:hypothetical protein
MGRRHGRCVREFDLPSPLSVGPAHPAPLDVPRGLESAEEPPYLVPADMLAWPTFLLEQIGQGACANLPSGRFGEEPCCKPARIELRAHVGDQSTRDGLPASRSFLDAKYGMLRRRFAANAF